MFCVGSFTHDLSVWGIASLVFNGACYSLCSNISAVTKRNVVNASGVVSYNVHGLALIFNL